jgi:hypothetical protein
LHIDQFSQQFDSIGFEASSLEGMSDFFVTGSLDTAVEQAQLGFKLVALIDHCHPPVGKSLQRLRRTPRKA